MAVERKPSFFHVSLHKSFCGPHRRHHLCPQSQTSPKHHNFLQHEVLPTAPSRHPVSLHHRVPWKLETPRRLRAGHQQQHWLARPNRWFNFCSQTTKPTKTGNDTPGRVRSCFDILWGTFDTRRGPSNDGQPSSFASGKRLVECPWSYFPSQFLPRRISHVPR